MDKLTVFIRKKEVETTMSYLYIGITLGLVLIYWLMMPPDFIFNKVSYSAIMLGVGLKFNLRVKGGSHWLFREFKYPWLNGINILVQYFVNWLLFGNFSILSDQLRLDNEGAVLVIGILGILSCIPIVYCRWLKKNESLLGTLLQALLLFVITIFFLFDIGVVVSRLFSATMNDLQINFLSCLTTLLLIFTLYAVTLSKNHFSTLYTVQKDRKYLDLIIFYFIVIWPIDSAIWYHPINEWHYSLSNFLLSFSIGMREEFIFRGMILLLLLWCLRKYKFSISISLGISSAIFGLIHLINLTNPELAPSSVIFSTIDAGGIGFLFGVIFLMYGNLWLPIVIHVIWDFMQHSATDALNMSVSGIEGILISSSVGIASIILSMFLYKRNEERIKENVRKILHV